MLENLKVIDTFDERLSAKRGYLWLAWALILAVAVIPRVLDLDVFYARDELAIWPWADEFALAIWNGDPAGTLTTSDYPGIPMYWAQTLFLTVKYAVPSLFQQTMLPVDMLFEDRSLELLAERRMVVGLFVAAQIVAAVWLVRRLFGWSVALASAIFMGLDPFSLTEARVVRLEMISAMFVCLAILSYFLYLRDRRRRWVLISGVLAGLGVSAKTSAGLVVPYIWLLLAFDFFLAGSFSIPGDGQPWPKRVKRLLVNSLLWAAGAVGSFWLIWPAMWVKPFEAMQYIFLAGFGQAADRSVWGDKVFFWGEVLPGDPGPFFYPTVLAFRTTPLTWIGLAGALLLLGYALLRPNRQTMGWPATGIILLGAYILLTSAELTFIISKVDRFLLIIFPALNILAVIGLVGLLSWPLTRLAQRPGRIRLAPGWLIAAGLIVLLAGQIITIWPAHPYYYTYWNPWVGGGKAAMDILPMGAGEGVDLAMNYLNRQPNASEITVVCGASEPWCERVFAGRTLRSATYVSGEWVTADYATFYISHLQRQINPAPIVDFFMAQDPRYRADLAGATYMWVYDIPKMDYYAGEWNILDGQGQLLGYNLSSPAGRGAAGQAGDTIEATIWWINMGAGVNNLALRWVDETGYEWGRAGVTPWPEYASIPAEQPAVLAGNAALPIPPGAPPGDYYLRIGAVEPATGQLVGEFQLPADADQLTVLPGQIFTEPTLFEMAAPLEQRLAPEITLLGYTPPDQLLTAAAPTWLTLYWQAEARPTNYEVRLRLLDSAGQERYRWQGQPGHGHYPTSQWQPGQIVQDVWALQVGPDTPVGPYRLEISLVDLGGGQPQIGRPTAIVENLEVWPQPISYDITKMQAEVGANFGDRLTLLGYDLYFDTAGAGAGSLSPILYWQSQKDFEGSFDLIFTLREASTNQPVKSWQAPLGSGQAKRFWKANEVFNTIHQFDAAALVGGQYHLDISVQDQANGQVEAVKDAAVENAVRIENLQDKIVVRVEDQ